MTPLPVLYDHRETPSGIPDALTAAGVPAAAEQLPAGDYVLSDRLAVERKIGSDLAASIKDRRVFDRIDRLTVVYPVVVLLVEGPRPHLRGQLEGHPRPCAAHRSLGSPDRRSRRRRQLDRAPAPPRRQRTVKQHADFPASVAQPRTWRHQRRRVDLPAWRLDCRRSTILRSFRVPIRSLFRNRNGATPGRGHRTDSRHRARATLHRPAIDPPGRRLKSGNGSRIVAW